MDWKHNQWVGVGAAILVVAGIVLIFTWLSRSGPGTKESSGTVYLCDSTNESFVIRDKEFESFDVFKTYHAKAETGLPCRVCGKEDAYWAYYCQVCQTVYKHKKGDDLRDTITCPKGHVVDASW